MRNVRFSRASLRDLGHHLFPQAALFAPDQTLLQSFKAQLRQAREFFTRDEREFRAARRHLKSVGDAISHAAPQLAGLSNRDLNLLCYEFFEPFYNQHMPQHIDALARAFAGATDTIEFPPGTLLDPACGTGTALEAILPHLRAKQFQGPIVANDLSPHMLLDAHDRLAKLWPAITFSNHDLRSLPLDLLEDVSVVFMSYCVHGFPFPQDEFLEPFFARLNAGTIFIDAQEWPVRVTMPPLGELTGDLFIVSFLLNLLEHPMSPDELKEMYARFQMRFICAQSIPIQEKDGPPKHDVIAYVYVKE